MMRLVTSRLCRGRRVRRVELERGLEGGLRRPGSRGRGPARCRGCTGRRRSGSARAGLGGLGVLAGAEERGGAPFGVGEGLGGLGIAVRLVEAAALLVGGPEPVGEALGARVAVRRAGARAPRSIAPQRSVVPRRNQRSRGARRGARAASRRPAAGPRRPRRGRGSRRARARRRGRRRRRCVPATVVDVGAAGPVGDLGAAVGGDDQGDAGAAALGEGGDVAGVDAVGDEEDRAGLRLVGEQLLGERQRLRGAAAGVGHDRRGRAPRGTAAAPSGRR